MSSLSESVLVLREKECERYPYLKEHLYFHTFDTSHIRFCKAESYPDHIAGTFAIPSKKENHAPIRFAYAMDQNHLIFIDESGFVKSALKKIMEQKSDLQEDRGELICHFLEYIIRNDLIYLTEYEDRLADMESHILSGEITHCDKKIMDCQKDILKRYHYYLQLSDLTTVLEEEEDLLFSKEVKRYFGIYSNRIDRLKNQSQLLRDYVAQIQQVYQSQLDIRQNNIMKILTIVTTIFLPLSLIAGWYGMNFTNMPELAWKYGYLAVILVSLAIILFCIWLFKKMKFW